VKRRTRGPRSSTEFASFYLIPSAPRPDPAVRRLRGARTPGSRRHIHCSAASALTYGPSAGNSTIAGFHRLQIQMLEGTTVNDRTDRLAMQIRPAGKGGEPYGFHAEPGGSAQSFGDG